MESNNGITLRFLEDFLPPWDKIKSFTVTSISNTNKFNTFPTIIKISVKVVFENSKKKPMNIIVRTPASESLGSLRRLKWFEKEIFFHDIILIEFKNLVSNCDMKEKAVLKLNTESFIAGSICNVTADPLENFIATSNLTLTRGFQKSKLPSLDFNHCQQVVKELAKLHALSWAYKKSKAVLHLQKLHPVIEETFISESNLENLQTLIRSVDLIRLTSMTHGEDSEEVQMVQNLIKKGTDVAETLIKFLNYQGLNEREIEAAVLSETISNDEDFIEESWAVGSHGNLQTANLLFKYDPKNPQEVSEVALLNFNCYRECCPTIDLTYFLYTSADNLTRNIHLQDLLQLYHDNFLYFCRLLKKCPYPGFTVNSLTRRYNRAKIFGLLTSILLSSATTATDIDGSQQKELTEDKVDVNSHYSDFISSAKNEEKNFESVQTRITNDNNTSTKESDQQRSF